MKIDILTLFPEMFAPLDHSIIRRGREAGLLEITVTNIRDYATDKHQTTDERLYGGGSGMVLKPDVLAAATRAVTAAKRPRVLVTSPAGRPFDQALARELAKEDQLIIVCGHYEGIDQRYIDAFATDVVSLGDFVLTGGEIPALAITDCVSRLIPGVLGDERAAEEESFSAGLLEYPQYTRPPVFEGAEVPAVLQEGDHAKIAAWRRQRSLENTYHRRPELLQSAPLTREDAAFLGELRKKEEKPFRLYAALLHFPVYDKKRHVINTSLTNLDLHDISRAAATYALSGYYLVQPLTGQRELIAQLIDHWQTGFGHKYNPDRETALSLAHAVPYLEDAVADIKEKDGVAPRLIATGAGLERDLTGYGEMRRLMQKEGGSFLLLFGTGWGLTREVIDGADFRLPPIYGREGYNHLSVRSAASIIIDRLLGRDD
ncbi:MAG: tRNA (guanosine(37)-N1)-methyltransferase TrmD [Firmicutes bacterium]|nr:tRNA (guanosine(37)-N1)-methyltransferase TrmD [Bacillota bacterium]